MLPALPHQHSDQLVTVLIAHSFECEQKFSLLWQQKHY